MSNASQGTSDVADRSPVDEPRLILGACLEKRPCMVRSDAKGLGARICDAKGLGARFCDAKGLGARVCDAKHAACCGHELHSRCNDALIILLRLWDKSVKTAVVFAPKLYVVLSGNIVVLFVLSQKLV